MKLRTDRGTLATDVDCGRPDTASNTCLENKAFQNSKRIHTQSVQCFDAFFEGGPTAAPSRACWRGRGGAPVRVRFGVLNNQAIARYEANANQ